MAKLTSFLRLPRQSIVQKLPTWNKQLGWATSNWVGRQGIHLSCMSPKARFMQPFTKFLCTTVALSVFFRAILVAVLYGAPSHEPSWPSLLTRPELPNNNEHFIILIMLEAKSQKVLLANVSVASPRRCDDSPPPYAGRSPRQRACR